MYSARSFIRNIYEPPRKCCKQKTYAKPNSFRCNTYKKQGGGSYRFFRTFGRSDLSTLRRLPGVHSLSCTLLSLFASRVFHISFAINPFHTLSQNCRGVTQQFPFWLAPSLRGKLATRHSPLYSSSFSSHTYKCPFRKPLRLASSQMPGGMGAFNFPTFNVQTCVGS